MRDVVNKNVTEEQLMETARRVFSRGWSKMKLYFMIGLPTEEDEDVLGIVQTGSRAQAIGKRLFGRAARVTVSVSTHVPKPHTPFQWCAMDTTEQTLRKQALLKQEARRTGVTLRMHDSEGSFIEGVLARGDRSLCDVLESAYRRGARFDSWGEQLKLDAWHAAFAEAGVDPQLFLGTIPVSARLPWDHIDVGLESGFLAREYRKALKNRLSPPCGKAVGMFVHHTNLEEHEADRRKLVCYDCGVACDMSAMHDRRSAYLVQLGARSPRVQPSEAVPTGEAAAAPAPRPRGPRKPPVRADQGQPIRLRLQFEKLGRAAFGSHLDLVRLLPRLFRRHRLPLYYSLGFHQKPVLVFSPALPLGILSLAEYVDLKLAAGADFDCDALPELLSAASIDGVRFLDARVLGPDDPKLSRVIDQAEYVAGLPRAALAQLGLHEPGALQARIAQALQQPLIVRREIEGIGKRVDVGQFLLGAHAGEGSASLARAGLVGDLFPIALALRITPAGTAKPSEVIEALFGRTDLPVRFVRTALLCSRNGALAAPMDLAGVRAAHHAQPRNEVAAEAPG
jgi:radical SAM-linked protein